MPKTKTATAKPTKTPSKKSAAASSPSGASAPVAGSQDAFDRFLPQASALAAKDILVCRADPSLVFHNVNQGAAALLAERGRIASELPKVDVVRIGELPALALAVAFAASQVNRTQQTNEALAKNLAQAHPLRRKLLASATALAEAGLLASGDVEKIRKGQGHIDAASDLVALAALFAKSAKAIAGKSPVTAADVKRADALGTELLATLKPASAKKTGARPGADAADARDRLWTLLVQRHDEVRRAGAWIFGVPALDAKVPALLAHKTAPKKKQATTTPVGATSAAKGP